MEDLAAVASSVEGQSRTVPTLDCDPCHTLVSYRVHLGIANVIGHFPFDSLATFFFTFLSVNLVL